MAADYGAIEHIWNDSDASDLCVDFGNKEFPGAAHLLPLGLDECAGHLIPENDALGVQLHSCTSIDNKVVDRDKLFALVQ